MVDYKALYCSRVPEGTAMVEILTRLDALQAQMETLMASTKEDLAAIQKDLDAIKANGAGAVADLQAKVDALTAQVAALKAGDVVTAEQEAANNAAADAVVTSADALAALFPPATPA